MSDAHSTSPVHTDKPINRLRAILRGRLAYLAQNAAVVQPVVGFRWTARLEQ